MKPFDFIEKDKGGKGYSLVMGGLEDKKYFRDEGTSRLLFAIEETATWAKLCRSIRKFIDCGVPKRSEAVIFFISGLLVLFRMLLKPMFLHQLRFLQLYNSM
jgi:hypothetical protein